MSSSSGVRRRNRMSATPVGTHPRRPIILIVWTTDWRKSCGCCGCWWLRMGAWAPSLDSLDSLDSLQLIEKHNRFLVSPLFTLLVVVIGLTDRYCRTASDGGIIVHSYQAHWLMTNLPWMGSTCAKIVRKPTSIEARWYNPCHN
jgi:hypothetical protein